MDPKSFDELMKQRHSARYFQKKEIPENILKQIMSTALQSPSWCNSQTWGIYVASGNTLAEIRKLWISNNNEGVKGLGDLNPGHRTETDEKTQKKMNALLKNVNEFLSDNSFMDAQKVLFNAPSVVYLTLPKKRIAYSLLDLGAIEMSILLAAKSHGVDSIIAYEAIKYPDVIRKFCKVPEDEDIIIGIGLGYEDDSKVNKFRAQKMTLDEACHFFN